MTLADREAVRKQLASLLAIALVGVGKPCKHVTPFKPSSITQAPLVAVMSGGSQRRWNVVDDLETAFMFALAVFVPDADAASGWTEQDVENRLDWIEREIAKVLKANRNTPFWADLAFSGEGSVVEDVTISGAQYATEVHMVQVTLL